MLTFFFNIFLINCLGSQENNQNQNDKKIHNRNNNGRRAISQNNPKVGQPLFSSELNKKSSNKSSNFILKMLTELSVIRDKYLEILEKKRNHNLME